jgi:hypothetical protein
MEIGKTVRYCHPDKKEEEQHQLHWKLHFMTNILVVGPDGVYYISQLSIIS